MRAKLAAALLVLSAAPSSAQVLDWRRPKKAVEEPPPLALALDLTFSTTFWNEVQVSTMGAVSDVGDLVRSGYYKLEIIQLVLISQQGRQPLKKTVEKRRKGASLADLAAVAGLSYDKLLEVALAVQEIVDAYLPSFPERRPRRERDDW